jgi:signal peptidase II
MTRPFHLGVLIALVTAVADQALKLWLLYGYDLGARGMVSLAPFLDLVLTWNRGISYGLFQQEGSFGRWLLLVLTAGAVILLGGWLARAKSHLTGLALGLIIGGAIGNAIDRLHWAGVMDFLLFYLTIGPSRYNWYVFNLADAAIVAGVIGLLYESLFGHRAAKAP